MPDAEHVIKKISLIGDPCVGKTSLIRRYVQDEFSDKYITTLGAKSTKKDLQISGESIGQNDDFNLTLMIWDMVGQQKMIDIVRRYAKNSDGALVVADITSEDIFKRLRSWSQFMVNINGFIPILFLLNKVDLVDRDEVDLGAFESLCQRYQSKILFSSAKDGENVEMAFHMIGARMITEMLYRENATTPILVLRLITRDFCAIHGGRSDGMMYINAQAKKIGMDLTNPTINKVEQLALALNEITLAMEGADVADVEKKRYHHYLHQCQE